MIYPYYTPINATLIRPICRVLRKLLKLFMYSGFSTHCASVRFAHSFSFVRGHNKSEQVINKIERQPRQRAQVQLHGTQNPKPRTQIAE